MAGQTRFAEQNDRIVDLDSDEISAVEGAGLFNWISRVTAGYTITILGIEVSDGIPND